MKSLVCKVICMNDTIMCVVVGYDIVEVERLASDHMLVLSDKYFEAHKWNFNDNLEYKTRCYWHLQDAPALTVGGV